MDPQLTSWFNSQWEQIPGAWGVFFPEALLAVWALMLVLGILLGWGPGVRQATILVLFLLGAGLLVSASGGPWAESAGMVQPRPWNRYLQALMAFSAAWGLYFIGGEEKAPDQRPAASALWVTTLLLGGMLLGESRHLILIFFALELLSIPSYLLASGRVHAPRSAEAAMKFFLFGVFSAALLLYGAAWHYGFAGSLLADGSALRLAPVSAQIGIPMLIFCGLFFKAGLFPFHFWAPDLYAGVGMRVAALLSIAPKVAAFAAMWNLLAAWSALPAYPALQALLFTLAVASMSAGNLGALVQDHFLRLMAFSGIAHAGFLLMAVALGGPGGAKALGFYLTLYVVMNAGAFLAADRFERLSSSLSLAAWKGLGAAAGLAGVAWVAVLAGLAGLPPSGGFIAKWWVFAAMWDTGKASGSPFFWAVFVAVGVNAVIGVFYYLRMAAAIYFRPGDQGDATQALGMTGWLAIAAAVLTIGLGLAGFDRLADFVGGLLWNFKLFPS